MTTKKKALINKRASLAEKEGVRKVAEFAPAKGSSAEKVERDRLTAVLHVSPAAMGAVASVNFLKNCFGETDIEALCHSLKASMTRVNNGDLAEVESMLIGQAVALQAMFASLSRRAFVQDQLKQYETHFRLALKAQSQCCRTIEVLSAMKNPPIVLARQANVTTGPQQINNGVPAPGVPPACGEAKPIQNELLERNHVKRMDPGTQGESGQGHTEMETVGAKHRAR